MILLVTALKLEADPLIRHFRMKKDMSASAFPVFRSEEAVLAVSGTGKVRSAMAAAMLLSLYAGDIRDAFLANIGLCGSADPGIVPGSLFAVAKVTDMDTARDYYPDVFPELSVPWASAACFPHPAGDAERGVLPAGSVLCDMESAGVMEAAGRFLETHRVLLLKLVSDAMAPGGLDPAALRDLFESRVPDMAEAVSAAEKSGRDYSRNLFREDRDLLSGISAHLRFTCAMTQQLEREVRRARLEGIDPTAVLEEAGRLTATTKTEGKKAFAYITEQLRQRPL